MNKIETYKPLEIESPSPPAKKVKSLSGRILTYCNQTKPIRALINPNNKRQIPILSVIAKIVRFVIRFHIGVVAGFVGGALGTLWHLSGAIIWGGDRKNRIKHLKSAGADFYRFATFGIFTGFGYGFAPDTYFAKGDKRSDGSIARPVNDFNTPIGNETIAFALLYDGLGLVANLFLLAFTIR